MLFEFDPTALESVLFIVGAAAIFVAYRWSRRRMLQKVRDSIASYSTPISNVVVTFWREAPHDPPSSAELNMIVDLWDAARRAWPDLERQLADIEYNIWLVRSPSQLVGWRAYGGIEWRHIPDVAYIPESSEGMGYGGMADRGSRTGTMYIATYFPGRDPSKLLAHEMTHCVKPIRGHTSEFIEYERKLLAEAHL